MAKMARGPRRQEPSTFTCPISLHRNLKEAILACVDLLECDAVGATNGHQPRIKRLREEVIKLVGADKVGSAKKVLTDSGLIIFTE